jgi:hypothetical protein
LARTISTHISLEEYFKDAEESRLLFEALRATVEAIGAYQLRVTKSQVAFHRRRTFAWAWVPGKYLHGRGAPLVLTLALSHHDPSPRWKQVVEPRPGRFTHHLELYSAGDIDAQVCKWLEQAWQEAA